MLFKHAINQILTLNYQSINKKYKNDTNLFKVILKSWAYVGLVFLIVSKKNSGVKV